MKKIGIAIFLSLSLFGCEDSNNNLTRSITNAQIDESDIENFQNLIGDTVLFSVDQSGLRPEAITVLNSQVNWLKRKEFLPITIEGHADEQGTREYNLALGARRATAVKEFFLAKGIEEARINIVTYGKERPLRVCSNEECWAKNRRAVTVVGKKIID
ncbi:peptidoglycan-associated lipoprotein Pal [Paracoccaceae bacterium]|nr:peptidoglycan-associated lipoprotein Pal [Paracoccaceae bacterium]